METLLREALVRKTSHDSSTEHAQVFHHEIYVRQVLQKCTNLFSNYPHIQLYLVSEKRQHSHSIHQLLVQKKLLDGSDG